MTRHIKDEFPINEPNLDNAFELIFGTDMMKELYGKDVDVGPWKCIDESKKSRKIKGAVKMHGAPKEILKVLGGNTLRATTAQTIKTNVDEIHVDHNVKMHFLGAELVRVKPTFVLKKEENRSIFAANVKLDAFFPPPLNFVIEGFMANFAKNQVAIVKKFSNVNRERPTCMARGFSC